MRGAPCFPYREKGFAMKIRTTGAGLGLAACLVAAAAFAAEPGETELAKKAQNPVADLISVPFQNNFNFGVGPDDELQYILNVQPVIPVRLNEQWNVITRTILPLVYQPTLAFTPGGDVGDRIGLGDTQFSAFLSPSNDSGWIWGVGPILQLATATSNLTGNQQWAAGPTAVVLRIDGPWVYGGLVNQLWSYAGDRDNPGTNQLLVQPFLNYNLKNGWYLSSAPVLTANWKAASDNTWTVPVGGGVGKIVRLGKLPLNGQLQAFYNVERPSGGSDWQLRLQMQFLFPR